LLLSNVECFRACHPSFADVNRQSAARTGRLSVGWADVLWNRNVFDLKRTCIIEGNTLGAMVNAPGRYAVLYVSTSMHEGDILCRRALMARSGAMIRVRRNLGAASPGLRLSSRTHGYFIGGVRDARAKRHAFSARRCYALLLRAAKWTSISTENTTKCKPAKVSGNRS